jgi:hypothetical protein
MMLFILLRDIFLEVPDSNPLFSMYLIALELGLSMKTVEFHRAHMMKKMKVDSVAELVYLFISATKE